MAEPEEQRRSVCGLDIGNRQWACVEFIMAPGPIPAHVHEVVGRRFPYDEDPNLPSDCAVAVIDVPIGLLDDADAARTNKGRSGDRGVDKGARKWCRSTSSVFPPPTTGQLQTGVAEHERARAATARVDRKRKLANVSPQGLTQQSLELLPAIASAAKLKARYPDRVYESHPEVAFAAFAGGILPAGKMSLSGALARASLLSMRLGMDCLRWVLEREGETDVSADNWLDALAMGVVALDWLVPGDRKVLLHERGTVEKWQGQRDRLIALPATASVLPQRLARRDAIDGVFHQLGVTGPDSYPGCQR